MQQDRTLLFEETPIPRAVATLAVPTILSSLVMVLYNLADTYFVGMLNDPVQNAAVTLAAPVLLAFNAVNNLFGVGSFQHDEPCPGPQRLRDRGYNSSAFGFYCSILQRAAVLRCSCTVFAGAPAGPAGRGCDYLGRHRWAICSGRSTLGAVPAILNVVMAYLVRAEGAAMHASIGTMSGCFLNIVAGPHLHPALGL